VNYVCRKKRLYGEMPGGMGVFHLVPSASRASGVLSDVLKYCRHTGAVESPQVSAGAGAAAEHFSGSSAEVNLWT
jgi:hypothetical protein